MSLGAAGCGTAYLAFQLTGAPGTSTRTFVIGFVAGTGSRSAEGTEARMHLRSPCACAPAAR
jgi:hypothetical protein